MTAATGNDDPRVISGVNKAIALAAGNQLSGAVELLTKLMGDFPRAAGVRAYLAWYMSEIGLVEEAIERSRQAVELAPNSEKGSLIHFHVLWKNGRRIEALEEMKRLLTIRPSDEYDRMIKGWEPNFDESC